MKVENPNDGSILLVRTTFHTLAASAAGLEDSPRSDETTRKDDDDQSNQLQKRLKNEEIDQLFVDVLVGLRRLVGPCLFSTRRAPSFTAMTAYRATNV